MDSYSYSFPSNLTTETKKIYHIVDNTPEKYRSTYRSRIIDGRPSDMFLYKPPSTIPKDEMDYKYRNKITEYSPQKFNVNGIIREKYNYTLYENKNWTENIAIIKEQPKKINLPKPKPVPKPKPKPKPVVPKIEKEYEVINEEIEREEDKNKKFLKSNYIRKKDYFKNKKYKYKKININRNNYIRKKEDDDYNNEYENNIVNIYDVKNNEEENNNGSDEDQGSEVTKIKKITEQKEINGEFKDLITTKKEYKFHKTSTVKAPTKKK